MDNIETFAVIAFDFVLGYVERLLRNKSRVYISPDGKREKTEETERLETAVHVLHDAMDCWNGKD